MTLVRANGLAFRVEVFGSGMPLVLLHGFTGSIDSWRSVIDRLARDFRVVAIDLIGHGASDAPPAPGRYSFARALDDLAEIGALLGIDRAAWLGYSMGGRLALGLAIRHPERVSAMLLESATPGITDANMRAQRKADDDALARRIEEDGIESFVDDWERLPLWDSQRSLPAELLRRQREQRLGNRSIGLANSLRGMGQGAQPSLWDRLEGIDVPVCLIAGALDAKFAGIAGLMAACIPTAELCLVPGAGHAVHLEAPQQFTECIRRFLARHGNVAVTSQQERGR